jgi:hypothetical protein
MMGGLDSDGPMHLIGQVSYIIGRGHNELRRR